MPESGAFMAGDRTGEIALETQTYKSFFDILNSFLVVSCYLLAVGC